jgi:hypothetical protein
MTSGIPVDLLEKRAADQRRELQNSMIELRQTVKEKLDVKRNLRDYVWPAAGFMAAFGLVLGYTLAAIFAREGH